MLLWSYVNTIEPGFKRLGFKGITDKRIPGLKDSVWMHTYNKLYPDLGENNEL